MTEEKAKTKWCCANMSFPIEVSVAYQAAPITEYTQKCQGSQCMAWRKMPMVNIPGGNHRMRPDGGYCGLASKP